MAKTMTAARSFTPFLFVFICIVTYGNKGGGRRTFPILMLLPPFHLFSYMICESYQSSRKSIESSGSARKMTIQITQVLSLKRLALYSVVAKVACSQDIRSQERTCVISAPETNRVSLLHTSLNSQDGNLHFQVKMMINTGFRELEKEHMSLCFISILLYDFVH